MNRNIKRAALFTALTFSLSWLLAGSFIFFVGLKHTQAFLAMALVFMFMPSISAVIVQKYYCREPIREPLGISFRPNRWFLIAWLLPPAVALATLAVSLPLPGVEYSPEMASLFERLESMMTSEQFARAREQMTTLPIHPLLLALIQGLLSGVTINALAAFGEELGWRGFLQKELAHLGFWRSSLAIGFIWGLWHAPIISLGYNYPFHPLTGVFMMILFCMLLSPILSLVRTQGRSVIAAALLHGSLNGTAGITVMMIKGGSDLTTGVTGLAGFIILAIVNLGIYLYRK